MNSMANCNKCGSGYLFLKEKGTATGIYCGDCGAWLKWATKEEIRLIERQIELSKSKVDLSYVSNEDLLDEVSRRLRG
jgi:hypothetical protein